MNIVMPPPKPPVELGKAAATVNPFEATEEILPVTDEYCGLPPVLAATARKNDAITEKLMPAIDSALQEKDYKSAATLARAASYAQRIKINAVDSTIKAADSSAQLIRAKTDAELAKKLPNDAHGLTPELQKELIDIIARRRIPDVLDVQNVNN